MLRKYPAHVFLIGIYPALFLYGANVKEMTPRDALPAMAALLGICSLLFGAMWLAIRNPARAAVAVSAFLLIFFSYSNIKGAADSLHLPGGILFRHRDFCIFLFSLFALFAYRVARSKRDFAPATYLLNCMAIVLTAMPLYSIAAQSARGSGWLEKRNAELKAASTDTVSANEKHPDIFYIIFDRYAGNKSLEEFWGFDNSGIASYLESKGFFFAGDSVCNYTDTSRSLASSLNMTHLDFLAGDAARSDLPPNVETLMVRDNVVLRMLKRRGYFYTYVGSPLWSVFVRADQGADKTYYTGIHKYLDEFSMKIFSMTPAYFLFMKSLLGEEEMKHGIVSGNYEDLLDSATAGRSPRFVVAHLMSTHPPFAFKRDGGPMTPDELVRLGLHDAYIEQIIYTNGQIRRVVDHLLSRRDKPVIILQSDEGPYPADVGLREKDYAKIKCRNLNALYLPGITAAQRKTLYPGISPVNNFRLVFNFYFEKNYKLLPDTCRKQVMKSGVTGFEDFTESSR